MNEVSPGLYRHFKGTEYRVLRIGKHTETLEECVVYENEAGVWVRPLKMFTENVEHEGKTIPRFRRIS